MTAKSSSARMSRYICRILGSESMNKTWVFGHMNVGAHVKHRDLLTNGTAFVIQLSSLI